MSSALPPPPPPLYSLRGHNGAVNCLSFLHNSHLVSGDVEGHMKVWNLESRIIEIEYNNAHSHSVLSINRFDGGDEIFASCGRDGTVKIWNLMNNHGTPVLILKTGAQCFCNSSTDTDPNLILTAGADESAVQLWDIRTGKIAYKAHVDPERGMISSLQLKCATASTSSSCDLTLGAPTALIGSDDGSLSLLDLRSNQALSYAKLHDGAGAESGSQPLLAIAARTLTDGFTHIITGGGDSRMHRSCLTPANEIQKKDSCAIPVAGTSSIAYRCDGRIFVSAHWDKTVRLHDTKTLKPLAILRHHKDSVFGVAFGLPGSASRGQFASASKDGTLAVWDLYADRIKE